MQEYNDLKDLVEDFVKEKTINECADRAWLAMVSIGLDKEVIDFILDSVKGNLYE